jgi:GNAT superfamily N-acetyltransferase
MTRSAARELADIAWARANFHVYLVPGDQPKDAGDLLKQAGFRQVYRLIQMTGYPRLSKSQDELYRAETPVSRARIARFMSEQFFSKQTSSFRSRLADATVKGAGLELYCIAEDNHIRAGMMLFRENGMLGIYNLCTDKSHRRRGFGTRLVRWASDSAASTETYITLQCDPVLEPWYRSFGFDVSGVVEVFGLAKQAATDIMFIE